MRLRFSFTLRQKTLAATTASAVLVAVFLTLAFFVQMRGVMTDELRARARTVGIELANNLAFATFSGDTVGLKAAADATLRDIPDTAYVVFRGSKNEVLLAVAQSELAPAQLAQLPAALVPSGERIADEQVKLGGTDLVGVAAPMFIFESKASDDPLLIGETAEGATSADKTKTSVGMIQVGFKRTSLENKISAITTRALGLGVLAILASALIALFLARLLVVPLERLTRAASDIAQGDLRGRIEGQGSDEISELAQSFGTMAIGLRQVVTDLQQASSALESEAAVVLSTASQQATAATQQAAFVTQTSSTATEIAVTAQQATEYADSVITLTEKSNELSREGQRVVEESVGAMAKLGDQVGTIALSITQLLERSVQIGEIIATVRDVAEQSNLLALNAAIEASKAGEHGLGFAVVASEMRNLAEQSKRAATRVRSILSEVQHGTRVAVEATEEGSRRAASASQLAETAGRAIIGLAEVCGGSAQAARQIANNTRQQTIGVEQIVTAIGAQSRAMNEAVEGTRRIERVAGTLSGLSRRLAELVGRYRVET